MIDGFVHLDGAAPDPLSDLMDRLNESGVDFAIAVETWSGDTARHLQTVCEDHSRIGVALCYREQRELEGLLARPGIRALRVSTDGMERCEGWTAALVNSNKWLLPHAERGIVELAAKLLRVAEEFPALRIYVPHLAWPTGGADWLESIRQLSSVPRLMIGVSALSHFSKESFPHEDLRRLIDPLLQLFGPERLVAATGYPQSGKGRYADYIKLSGQWIRSVWPEWSDPDALLT